MKRSESRALTELSVTDIKNIMQDPLRKATISPLQAGSILDTTESAALEFLAEQQTFGGVWAVQVYVFERGSHREVALVALGDGGFSRAFNGIRHTMSLGKSEAVATEIMSCLRSADPGLLVR